MKMKPTNRGCTIFGLAVLMLIALVLAHYYATHAEDTQTLYLPSVAKFPPAVRLVYSDGMIDIDVTGQGCQYIDIDKDLLYTVSRKCSLLGWMSYPSTIDSLTVYVHYADHVVPIEMVGPWKYGE